MDDPWEKAYVYARATGGKVAHIKTGSFWALCEMWTEEVSHTPKPYPVCKNCLRTKRAKELGL